MTTASACQRRQRDAEFAATWEAAVERARAAPGQWRYRTGPGQPPRCSRLWQSRGYAAFRTA